MKPKNPRSRCYFSLLDFYSIEQMKGAVDSETRELVATRLRSKLKAAALLYDQVIFRATVLFPSDQNPPYARDLLDGARDLLAEGVLVPELRSGDEPLAKQLRDKPSRFNLTRKEARRWLQSAEAIDGAKEKHEPDSIALSKARSAQLIEHVFRQWCFRNQLNILKTNVTLGRLEELFSIMMRSTPLDRKKTIVPLFSELYKVPVNAQLLIQNIYFGLGAQEARSDLFLPEGLVLPNAMRSYPQLESNKLSLRARKVADKFGIGERVAYPAESYMVRADDVLAKIELLETALDSLNWQDILEIRKSAGAKKAYKKIWDIRRMAKNVPAWSEQLHYELLREQRRAKWSANVKTSLSFVGLFPIIGQFFSMLSLGIDLVERWPIVKAAFTPLVAFGDRVKRTEQRRLGR